MIETAKSAQMIAQRWLWWYLLACSNINRRLIFFFSSLFTRHLSVGWKKMVRLRWFLNMCILYRRTCVLLNDNIISDYQQWARHNSLISVYLKISGGNDAAAAADDGSDDDTIRRPIVSINAYNISVFSSPMNIYKWIINIIFGYLKYRCYFFPSCSFANPFFHFFFLSSLLFSSQPVKRWTDGKRSDEKKNNRHKQRK